MKELHLISVGKLKDAHIKKLEEDYLKRLGSLKVQIHEMKSEKDVITKLDSLAPCFPITLEEKGQQLSSPRFSQWLVEKIESGLNPVFILGGAAGHDESVLKRSNASISLGELTYPHQLARLLLVEQIYRAMCIKEGHPYHK